MILCTLGSSLVIIILTVGDSTNVLKVEMCKVTMHFEGFIHVVVIYIYMHMAGEYKED